MPRRRASSSDLLNCRKAPAVSYGVVRSQIDPLTPWSANAAAFGWSERPTQAKDNCHHDRGTARSLVAPIARATIAAQANQVRMFTRIGEGQELVVSVFAQDIGGGDEGQGLRWGIVAGLALSGFVFIVSLGAWLVVGGSDDARLVDLQNWIAASSSELMSWRGPAAEGRSKAPSPEMGDPLSSHGSRSAVECPPQGAPDRTEVRFRQAADPGSATDVPAPIRLIEQSRQFTKATFFHLR